MALQTKVKVSGINNLTDARYCAGMGVDMLGFCIDETAKEFIGFKKIEEIIQWISGVQFVGEIFGGQSKFSEQMLSYNFDFLEVNELHLPQIIANQEASKQATLLHLPLPDVANLADLRAKITNLQLSQTKISYFLLHSTQHIDLLKSQNKNLQTELALLCKQFPIFLGEGFDISADNVLDLLQVIQPAGIVLQGGQEIKAGLKDLDNLADVLEKLEVNE
jgi:phosphoribosylanthranilate isomerase